MPLELALSHSAHHSDQIGMRGSWLFWRPLRCSMDRQRGKHIYRYLEATCRPTIPRSATASCIMCDWWETIIKSKRSHSRFTVLSFPLSWRLHSGYLHVEELDLYITYNRLSKLIMLLLLDCSCISYKISFCGDQVNMTINVFVVP